MSHKRLAKVIMIQGTSSNVGKSVLVAALCRIFKQDGYKVAPFKAQNMALNAFVTPEGGEIGRAQAMQAEASGIAPSIHMNPVLLKPEANSRAQIIVQGKVYDTSSAKDYYNYTMSLLEKVKESLDYLRERYEIVVIEGAGSPAEINLKAREIANMRIAKLAKAPVLLAGDIDRGGVYAFLVGTLELLDETERKLVKGFIINKFRGDISLIKDANDFLEERTKIPILGVVPYYRDILLAQEDSVYLDERRNASSTADLDIAVIRSPRISNYDDFDPLEEDGANLRYICRPEELGNPDLIIIPGSKTTVPDLLAIRESGVAAAIIKKAKQGTPVFGACGGYQMLGKLIHDPDHVESNEDTVEGLGLIDAETTFVREKATTQVKGVVTDDCGLLQGLKGESLTGYEIHMGRTESPNRPFQITETQDGPAFYVDGSINETGTVIGSYIHGIFQSHGFRRGILNNLRRRKGLPERIYDSPLDKEKHYDALADLVRNSLDIKAIYRILDEGVEA